MNENHCYIVIYDLCAPGRNYNELYDAIKSYGTWGKLTESCWAIVSPKTSQEIAEHLHHYMDSNDRLMIIKSGQVATWYNAMAQTTWLKQNLVK